MDRSFSAMFGPPQSSSERPTAAQQLADIVERVRSEARALTAATDREFTDWLLAERSELPTWAEWLERFDHIGQLNRADKFDSTVIAEYYLQLGIDIAAQAVLALDPVQAHEAYDAYLAIEISERDRRRGSRQHNFGDWMKWDSDGTVVQPVGEMLQWFDESFFTYAYPTRANQQLAVYFVSQVLVPACAKMRQAWPDYDPFNKEQNSCFLWQDNAFRHAAGGHVDDETENRLRSFYQRATAALAEQLVAQWQTETPTVA